MKCLIADDHKIVRSGLVLLIKNNFPEYQLDEASDGKEVISMVKKKRYDLLLMDVFMPETNPFSTLEMIRVIQPDLAILIISMCSERIFAKRLFDAGVKGYINKTDVVETMVNAIKTVQQGEVYMSGRVKDILLDQTFRHTYTSSLENLSNRELEIFMLLVKGHSHQEIGEIIAINASTVGTYRSRIFEKLGISSVVDLVKIGLAHDIA